MSTVPIPLTQCKFALIDEADFMMVGAYKWYAVRTGRGVYYAQTKIERGVIGMQRLILDPPSDMVVDHISGDPLDNRRCNLRVVTPAQNNMNRRHHARSGYKGVYWRNRRWQAGVRYLGVYYALGAFDDPAEAARAYDTKARLLFGPYARLNFPLAPPQGTSSLTDAAP